MPVKSLPRIRIEPLAEQQFGFYVGDKEVTRWHFAPSAPRPYFFPVTGPSGVSLTRMGHPGAPNHDHHRSLWFAHNDLMGIDFWSENKPPRIRQSQWYAIEDGDDRATVALELEWLDGHDPKPVLRQDVFATLRPHDVGWTLELQSTFRADAEGIEFRQNNFGVLGLRVAKSLSVVFGGGVITGSDGQVNEANLFGKANRWLDYSGPIKLNNDSEKLNRDADPETEGLSLISHRSNPQSPICWHVRDDGWISPSLSRKASLLVAPESPVTCRYLLFVHSGTCSPATVNRLADEFDNQPALSYRKASKPHHQFEIYKL